MTSLHSKAADLPFTKVLELFQGTAGKELTLILQTPTAPAASVGRVSLSPAELSTHAARPPKNPNGPQMLTLVIKRAAGTGLGMGVKDSPSHRVNQVMVASNAEIAGVKMNDTIQSINGKRVVGVSHSKLIKLLKECGETTTVVVKRK